MTIVDPVWLQAYTRRLIKVLNSGPLLCLACLWNVKRTKRTQSAQRVYRSLQTAPGRIGGCKSTIIAKKPTAYKPTMWNQLRKWIRLALGQCPLGNTLLHWSVWVYGFKNPSSRDTDVFQPIIETGLECVVRGAVHIHSADRPKESASLYCLSDVEWL